MALLDLTISIAAPCLLLLAAVVAYFAGKQTKQTEQSSLALQPADCVDAWTEIFDFVGPITDECRFAKVSRAHAGIVRAAHERRGLSGFVWWSAAPTVRTVITSLLEGSLAFGRQRVVAPVYGYEVKDESSSRYAEVKFQDLHLDPPVLKHGRHHLGVYLKDFKGMPPFKAEVCAVAGPSNQWELFTPGQRALLGFVDTSLRWISIRVHASAKDGSEYGDLSRPYWSAADECAYADWCATGVRGVSADCERSTRTGTRSARCS